MSARRISQPILRRKTNHSSLIAPAEIIREDFRDLGSSVLLRTAWNVEQLVLMQSVTSHAHMGHGLFHGCKYPNTTEDDVARAMRLDPVIVKSDRQKLIDDIKAYAVAAIAGTAEDTLADADGEPLLGIGTFRQLRVDPKGVLQGLYVGGLRDRLDVRAEAEKRYGVTIGWGKCYLINKRIMRDMNLSGDVLARQPHGDRIDEFKRIGMIVDMPDKDVAYMYIRHHAGPGASDDAGIIMAGKLYGPSAAVGAFLADAVDTLEKYATREADQDAEIAEYIEANCPDLGVGRDDAVKIAFLAAAPDGHQNEVPDSSLRGLLEVDRQYDLCAIESHLLFAAGRQTAEIELDHGQSTTYELYSYIEDRLTRDA